MQIRCFRIYFFKNQRPGPPQVNFDGNFFKLNYKWFNLVFYADSEYHIHFAIKLCYGNENLLKTLDFIEKSGKTAKYAGNTSPIWARAYHFF